MFHKVVTSYLPCNFDRQLVEGNGAYVEAM